MNEKTMAKGKIIVATGEDPDEVYEFMERQISYYGRRTYWCQTEIDTPKESIKVAQEAINIVLKEDTRCFVISYQEAFFLRLRRRIAEGVIAPEDVELWFVMEDGSGRRIPLLPNGEVEWWPDGFFTEAYEEVCAMRRAARGDKRCQNTDE